tara:strand:- start:393 stop:851 length:459 start_codon:yes stop_codon:yes gene_type:complete
MLKSTQLGGKGTMRRKKKFVGNNFKTRITEKERLYIKKINTINEHIKLINDEDYNTFKIFLDNELDDMCLSIEKIDLRKEYNKNFEMIQEDSLSYIYNLLIKVVDKPLEFYNNNYILLKKRFEDDFMDLIIDFLNELENNLEKKKYLESKDK